MSHFTVTVCITKKFKGRRSVEKALQDMMAPYQENNMGDCPRQFMEFTDADEPELQPGENREDAFRDEGYEQHPDDPNRWGRWNNPNAKWEWYTIGGRWRGFFPVKSGIHPRVGEPGAFDNKPGPGSDIVLRKELDLDAAARGEDEALQKFKAEYRDLLGGKTFGHFDGPRDRALRMGLIRIERDPNIIVDKNLAVMPWNMVKDDRRVWRDICLNPSDEEFAKYRAAFNPLRTFACLDDKGWHSPGTMGLFACSDDTPESYMAFVNGFMENFIKPAAPDDLLVLVDCHI